MFSVSVLKFTVFEFNLMCKLSNVLVYYSMFLREMFLFLCMVSFFHVFIEI